MLKRKIVECGGRNSEECRKGKVRNVNEGRVWDAAKEK
jgi:hypothetical protein